MQQSDTFTSGLALAVSKVHSWVEGFYALLPNMIVGVTVLVLFCVFAYSLSRAITVYFDRRDRTDLGRILGDFGFWGLTAFGALLAMTIIIPSLKPANTLAGMGIGSLAFGFAFKDILQNWLSGLLILLRLPFRRGDQIKVGEAEGTVMRIEPRATIIRTYDGRDIVVPNTTIYTSIVTIHTSQHRRRVELDFTVGYVYEIRKITEIIRRSLAQIDEILQEPEPQILCWELGSTSLAMKVRWWINSERSQEVITRARAVQAIKEAFDANDIDPTDPQLVYYHTADKDMLESEATGKQSKEQNAQKKPTRRKEEETLQSYETGEDRKDIIAVPSPPEVVIDQNDPESETIKLDSKEDTLLSGN